MIITLDNGQSITIYENDNILKQIKPYIDSEIYELLNNNCRLPELNVKPNKFRLETNTGDLIDEKIKSINLVNGMNLDTIIISTHEGGLFIADIVGGDEYNYPHLNCIKSEEELNKKILADNDTRGELLFNGIINKEYVDKIKKERDERLKLEKERAKKKRYEQYLKLKKEFESEEI